MNRDDDIKVDWTKYCMNDEDNLIKEKFWEVQNNVNRYI